MTEAALAVHQLENLDRGEVRRRVIERFSPSRMVDGYEALYEGLLAARVPLRQLGAA